jgi:hypothetical protein
MCSDWVNSGSGTLASEKGMRRRTSMTKKIHNDDKKKFIRTLFLFGFFAVGRTDVRFRTQRLQTLHRLAGAVLINEYIGVNGRRHGDCLERERKTKVCQNTGVRCRNSVVVEEDLMMMMVMMLVVGTSTTGQ